MRPPRATVDARRSHDQSSKDLDVFSALCAPSASVVDHASAAGASACIARRARRDLYVILVLASRDSSSWLAAIKGDLCWLRAWSGGSDYASWTVVQWVFCARTDPARVVRTGGHVVVTLTYSPRHPRNRCTSCSRSGSSLTAEPNRPPGGHSCPTIFLFFFVAF